MWVTRSTSQITPILVEIEKPSKRWFRRDGRPTSEFTHAHDQLNDWRSWFARDGNKALFREKFLLLSEKHEDRLLEPQYVLIYGRESEFGIGGGHTNPNGLRYKRDHETATTTYTNGRTLPTQPPGIGRAVFTDGPVKEVG